MASTSSQSGSDGSRPSAEEAARALQDIDRRRGQAHSSATHARWVYVVFGVALFACVAAPDFHGAAAVGWVSYALAVLAVGYVVLLRTRRGSTLLGQPVRPHKDEFSRPFRRYARLTILAAVLAGLVFTLVQPDWHLDVPYLRTAVGVVIGVAMAVFGPSWQRSMLSAATRNSPRTEGCRADGAR